MISNLHMGHCGLFKLVSCVFKDVIVLDSLVFKLACLCCFDLLCFFRLTALNCIQLKKLFSSPKNQIWLPIPA